MGYDAEAASWFRKAADQGNPGAQYALGVMHYTGRGVPQDYADQLLPGLTALIHLPSQPGNLIEAKYLTTARAFSTNTRTAVTELTVDNSNHALWPGTYVDVTFQVPSDPKVLTMPEQALIFRAAGTQVAVVNPRTSSTTLPAVPYCRRLYTAPTARPTIMPISWSGVASPAAKVATRRPSRSTVTRSPNSKTSCIRCEM